MNRRDFFRHTLGSVLGLAALPFVARAVTVTRVPVKSIVWDGLGGRTLRRARIMEFTITEDAASADVVRRTMEAYFGGLRRHLILTGINAKPLGAVLEPQGEERA